MSLFSPNLSKLLGTEFGDSFEELTSGSVERLLHTSHPDNFEFYLIAFEIRDEDAVNTEQQIIRSLILPVNPERILQIQKKISKINKTQRGVVVNNLDTFVPIPVNLSGTFGRKLRLLYGSKTSDTFDENFLSSLNNFKTGFGTTKVLEEMFELSKSSNKSGNPYRTIFYNLSFSSSWIVEFQELKFSQSQDKNRMWMYDLQLTIVSPLEDVNYSPTNARIQELLNYKMLGNMFNRFFSNANGTLNNFLSSQNFKL